MKKMVMESSKRNNNNNNIKSKEGNKKAENAESNFLRSSASTFTVSKEEYEHPLKK